MIINRHSTAARSVQAPVQSKGKLPLFDFLSATMYPLPTVRMRGVLCCCAEGQELVIARDGFRTCLRDALSNICRSYVLLVISL